VKAARPYATKMGEVIGNLVERAEDSEHPLMEQREMPERTLVYAISSDRGLCGGFNSYLFRKVDQFIADEQLSGEQVSVVTAGTKGQNYFRRTKRHSEAHFDDVIELPGYDEARKIAKHAIDLFVSGKYDTVYIAYNEFISAIQYETRLVPILPLSRELFLSRRNEEWAESVEAEGEGAEYIFEPDEFQLLAETLPAYVEVLVLQALLESYASEWSARMTAMDNATSNADDMISSLTLEYNRARQAYITKEICEIVSGAESLKG
jgi:F-type H+-transporting ATPase subunit gamma